MFAKCVRILYGNITVLLAVVVVAFCARFRSSLACPGMGGGQRGLGNEEQWAREGRLSIARTIARTCAMDADVDANGVANGTDMRRATTTTTTKKRARRTTDSGHGTRCTARGTVRLNYAQWVELGASACIN